MHAEQGLHDAVMMLSIQGKVRALVVITLGGSRLLSLYKVHLRLHTFEIIYLLATTWNS
jgi:hypothetical protein